MFKKTVISEEEKTCMLIDYPKKINCIKIPQIIDGYKVITARWMLFSNNNYIEKIIFPEGFKAIPAHLCYKCTSLKAVEMPDTVEKIEVGAFCSCYGLHSIKMSKNIKYIDLTAFLNTQLSKDKRNLYDNVFYLDNYLIDGKNCVGEHKIKEGTTLIASEAFNENKNLEKITFPKSLEVICDRAFQCSGLKELEGGNGIKSIMGGAFYKTPIQENALKKSSFFCVGDMLVKVNPYTTKGDITICSGIKRFSNDAFRYCRNITSVSYPKEIDKLHYGLFTDCVELKEVKIPQTVQIVDSCCFSGCKGIKNLTIHETTNIHKDAFIDCSSIENVTIIDEKGNPTSFSICNQSLDNILFD